MVSRSVIPSRTKAQCSLAPYWHSMNDEPEYERLHFEDKDLILLMLGSSDTGEVCRALIGMVYGVDDWKWCQDQLLRFVHHEEHLIAYNAIVGVGMVALFRKKLDVDRVKAALAKITDPSLAP